jgi:PKHD-type hydroxylase
MSRYDFVPIQHPPGRADKPYYFWENVFTDSQLDLIEKLGDSLVLKTATVGNDPSKPAPKKLRMTKVAWLAYEDRTRELYDMLGGAVQRLNVNFYNFALTGFVEDLQYSVYDKGAHYDWHIDAGSNSYSPRKLSISVQLTDPKKYSGGELQIMEGVNAITTCEKKRGTIIAFPSYMLHRVTPVTQGIRKSIVAWVSGPPFR